MIKEVTVKKIFPGTVYIQYVIRTPIAFVGDFSNTVIDEEGVLFPFRPFFTPKYLPKLYLGLNSDLNLEKYCWGKSVKSLPSVRTAFEFLQFFRSFKQEKFVLKQLDVAQGLADSYGQRQIVVVLKREQRKESDQEGEDGETSFSSSSLSSSDPISPSSSIILRLSFDHTEQDLRNFFFLVDNKEKILRNDSGMVIDFRIPHLALVK